jgi:hypothetical protein
MTAGCVENDRITYGGAMIVAKEQSRRRYTDNNTSASEKKKIEERATKREGSRRGYPAPSRNECMTANSWPKGRTIAVPELQFFKLH